MPAIDAVKSLTSGGQEVEYGLAALWAGILCVIGLAMTLFLSRRAKALQSPMLKLDARSWMVSAFLSLALLIGFAIATALAGTRLQGWIPYLDAIALLSMALIMLPMPLIGLWRSMSDVLQVAPDELDARVHAVMDGVVKERQFLEYSSYIAKVGRGEIRRDPRTGAAGLSHRYRDRRCDPERRCQIASMQARRLSGSRSISPRTEDGCEGERQILPPR